MTFYREREAGVKENRDMRGGTGGAMEKIKGRSIIVPHLPCRMKSNY